MDKKYERNLEKSFKDFQKRYYSMDDIHMDGGPPPTDGRLTLQAPRNQIRPNRRKMGMSQSGIDARVNSVGTKREQAPIELAMARADATNEVKKQIEAEKRQSREEQSDARSEETRRDRSERAQGYDDKIRNLQYESSVGSGPALANPYEGGLSKQMIAGSVASGRKRQIKPVVPEQVRASQSSSSLSRISRQGKADLRSTLPLEQNPTPLDRPIDLSVSATGEPMTSLTKEMSNLNVDSDSDIEMTR